jgi:adenine-specific DNA-methyltransferase
MPVLDWIGKKAVVNHHREVPYRLIHCDKDKSVGDPDAGNLLVQGDNLEALKALLFIGYTSSDPMIRLAVESSSS